MIGNLQPIDDCPNCGHELVWYSTESNGCHTQGVNILTGELIKGNVPFCPTEVPRYKIFGITIWSRWCWKGDKDKYYPDKWYKYCKPRLKFIHRP